MLIPQIPIRDVTLVNDTRLGPTGWAVVCTPRDVDGITEVRLGSTARPERPFADIDTDVLMLSVANLLDTPGIVWRVDAEALDQGMTDVPERMTRRIGLVADVVQTDGTPETVGIWVTRAEREEDAAWLQSLSTDPEQVLPDVVEALDLSEAPTTVSVG